MQLPQVRSKRKPGHWRGGIFIPHAGITLDRDTLTEDQLNRIADDPDLEFRMLDDQPWRSRAQIEADAAAQQTGQEIDGEPQEPTKPAQDEQAQAPVEKAPEADAAPTPAAAPATAAPAPAKGKGKAK